MQGQRGPDVVDVRNGLQKHEWEWNAFILNSHIFIVARRIIC